MIAVRFLERATACHGAEPWITRYCSSYSSRSLALSLSRSLALSLARSLSLSLATTFTTIIQFGLGGITDASSARSHRPQSANTHTRANTQEHSVGHIIQGSKVLACRPSTMRQSSPAVAPVPNSAGPFLNPRTVPTCSECTLQYNRRSTTAPTSRLLAPPTASPSPSGPSRPATPSRQTSLKIEDKFQVWTVLYHAHGGGCHFCLELLVCVCVFVCVYACVCECVFN